MARVEMAEVEEADDLLVDSMSKENKMMQTYLRSSWSFFWSTARSTSWCAKSFRMSGT